MILIEGTAKNHPIYVAYYVQINLKLEDLGVQGGRYFLIQMLLLHEDV